MPQTNIKKVLFIANTDWSFYHFWRPHLLALQQNPELEVVLACPEGPYVHELINLGFSHRTYRLNRSGTNPFSELLTVFRILLLIIKEHPSIVHNVTTKPAVYGSLAVFFRGFLLPFLQPIIVINSFMGLGLLFSSKNRRLQSWINPVLKVAFNRKRVFHTFSNEIDQSVFYNSGFIYKENSTVQLSESVDTGLFTPTERAQPEEVRCLMAVRMLWSKGVKEYVDAAGIIKERGYRVRFWLAGMPDEASPDAIPIETLEHWHRQQVIEWKQHVSDMAGLLREVDFVILPSFYNEGAPRIIVEGMASGKPVIASDIPGCRVLIRHMENGLLFPPKNARALADALEQLLNDATLCNRFRIQARHDAVSMYDNSAVSGQWVAFYQRLIG